jgi:hypothetical protein
MSTPPELEIVLVSSTAALVRWKGEGSRFEVQHRVEGDEGWQAVDDVITHEYKVLDLAPESDCHIRVRQAEKGIPPGPFSPEVRVRTPRHTARRWHGFEIVEPRHVPTFEGGQTSYPCLASHRDRLYLFERVGRVCNRKQDLSKVPGDWLSLSRFTESGEVLWTREIVPSPTPEGPYSYQGLLSTQVVGDVLYLCWNRQDTGIPSYNLTMSRQFLRTYDLLTGEVSEILGVPSDDPLAGVWAGGITAIGADVWVSYLKTYVENGKIRTQIALRSFHEGTFGPEQVWHDAPTPFAYAPLLAAYNEEVIILFPDVQEVDRDETREPLYALRFDGRTFHGLTRVAVEGRSRYAKAVQWGDELILAYKASAQYYERCNYQFHDVALAAWDPSTGRIDRGFFAEEMRYLSSPHPIRHRGEIWITYMRVQSLERYERTQGAFVGALRPIPGQTA